MIAGFLAVLVNSLLVAHQASATTVLPVPGNEIQNASFEMIGGPGPALLAPWGLDTKAGTAARLSSDTGTAVSGAASARIDVSRTNGSYWGVQLDQAAPTAAGGIYRISFWAKTSWPRTLPLSLQQAAAPYTVHFSATAALTTAWQQFTFAYYAPAGDPGTLLHLDAGVLTGTIWIDDVAVTDPSGPGTSPTPTASATASATATIPTTTGTPTPTATAPLPTATSSTTPSSTATAPPATATSTATSTPRPTATDTPPPTATSTTLAPSATNTPPAATATATATATSGSVAGNEIQNPSFETAGGTGPNLFSSWWLDTKSGTVAALAADTASRASGSISARIDVSQINGFYWGVQLDQVAPLMAGREYRVSFRARSSSPRALPVALQQGAAPHAVYFSPVAALTTAWQLFTFSYNATGSDPSAVLHIDAGLATGSVWIDDVSVTALDGSGAALPTPTPYAGTYFRGVNLKGGDQGLYGSVDTFGTGATLDWLKVKGFTTLRVPFSWAHLQPTADGPLAPAYLAMMDGLVAGAKQRGMRVAFVPLHRPDTAYTSLVSLWSQLARHYAGEQTVWGYDVMNEPDGDAWNMTTLPAIVAAIRAVDMSHTIIVETAAGGWSQDWAAHLDGLPVSDPANNLLYEGHFYFDTPANGQYPHGTAFDVPNGDLNIGVERATDFVTWCRASGVRCYAGEYGIPGGWTRGDAACTDGTPYTDPRWLTALDRFMSYLDQNHISGSYWEAGPFGDINDLGPTCSGQDRPQMAVLQRHPGMG